MKFELHRWPGSERRVPPAEWPSRGWFLVSEAKIWSTCREAHYFHHVPIPSMPDGAGHYSLGEHITHRRILRPWTTADLGLYVLCDRCRAAVRREVQPRPFDEARRQRHRDEDDDAARTAFVAAVERDMSKTPKTNGKGRSK